MIRRATADDMPRVWELVQELADFERLTDLVVGGAEAMREHLGRFFDCYVFELEGAIVAYCLTFTTYSTFRTQPGMWLEDLYVTPTHRGQGIGRALLEFLIEEAKTRGFGRLEWSVLDWNADAIGFYRRLGADLHDHWRLCRVTFPPPDTTR